MEPTYKILIVDDEAEFVDSVKIALGKGGYQVFCAADRDEAREPSAITNRI